MRGEGPKRPYLQPNTYRVTDDLSGFQMGNNTMKKTWDGFICDVPTTWYERQPQDFPLFTRGVRAIPNARPLNEINADGVYNYHVAGTDEENYLVFQDGSFIEFVFYKDEYVGNQV